MKSILLLLVVCFLYSCGTYKTTRNNVDVSSTNNDELEKWKILETFVPKYPDEMSKNKIEGKVILMFLLDEYGEVREIKTYKATNEIFEKTAIISVLGSRFAPCKKNNIPLRCNAVISVVFEHGSRSSKSGIKLGAEDEYYRLVASKYGFNSHHDIVCEESLKRAKSVVPMHLDSLRYQ